MTNASIDKLSTDVVVRRLSDALAQAPALFEERSWYEPANEIATYKVLNSSDRSPFRAQTLIASKIDKVLKAPSLGDYLQKYKSYAFGVPPKKWTAYSSGVKFFESDG